LGWAKSSSFILDSKIENIFKERPSLVYEDFCW
jgi:hypothetical protein